MDIITTRGHHFLHTTPLTVVKIENGRSVVSTPNPDEMGKMIFGALHFLQRFGEELI